MVSPWGPNLQANRHLGETLIHYISCINQYIFPISFSNSGGNLRVVNVGIQSCPQIFGEFLKVTNPRYTYGGIISGKDLRFCPENIKN